MRRGAGADYGGRVPVRLVLASASPARLARLKAAGIEPTVIVSGIDEEAAIADAEARYGPLAPSDLALVLARAKAEDVAYAATCPPGLVLGADSVLDVDGVVHGKPGTAELATERWRALRGRSAVLVTGHWLIDTREGATGATLGATASTTVHFADVGDAEIAGYVATGEPVRVAGGFTIDGLGAPFITAIEGDPSNVVGVSLPLVRGLLAELGLTWFDLGT